MVLRDAIAACRNSVGAVMRIHSRPPDKIDLSVTGTTWCVVSNRFFVAAHHVLNGGARRDPSDKFVVFVAPDNGPRAYHFPVVAFPFADPRLDLVIVEVGPPSEPGVVVPPLPVTT